jgi:hypothetical protein
MVPLFTDAFFQNTFPLHLRFIIQHMRKEGQFCRVVFNFFFISNLTYTVIHNVRGCCILLSTKHLCTVYALHMS